MAMLKRRRINFHCGMKKQNLHSYFHFWVKMLRGNSFNVSLSKFLKTRIITNDFSSFFIK